MVCVQLGHLVVTLPALTECAADLVTLGFAEPEAVFPKVFSSTLSWESDLIERNLALQVNAGAPVFVGTEIEIKGIVHVLSGE